ncbi:MAG: hypothetical protein JO067_07965 [Cupriavidus sp.]|nr:hypothetical protein [Cupriavidus sp.]
MSNLRLQIAMVLATIVMFTLTYVVNEWLFIKLEFAPGITWIYLPAGMRLLSTLLFAEAGAVGLLIASWLVCFHYVFPDDFSRAFMGGILAAVAPYLTYKLAQHYFGLKTSLANLTPKRLLVFILAYSVTSPLLHHVWFYFHDHAEHVVEGFLVMFAGDLVGTLVVIYTFKGLLWLMPRRRTTDDQCTCQEQSARHRN